MSRSNHNVWSIAILSVAVPALALSAIACGGEPIDVVPQTEEVSPGTAGPSSGATAVPANGTVSGTNPGAGAAAAPWPLVINFQPHDMAAPTGTLADTGEVFGDRGQGLSYGWTVDHTARAVVYDRPLEGIDERFWSLVEMLPGDARWEIAVPNGRYSVRVVVGAPIIFGYPQRISVEGVATVDETPAEYEPWVAGTSVVQVSDGRISVGNTDGVDHNRLCFVEIAPETPAPSP